MKNFYLFRHGLATYSKHGYENEMLSASVLPNETEPIEKMGKYLKEVPTDFNVSSNFLRCRQTAEIIEKESGKKFVFDKRIGEFFIKDSNSRDFVVDKSLKGIYSETFEHFTKRIKDFLADIERKNYKDILICTHGDVISAIQSYILKGDFQNEDATNFPKTGVLRIIKNKVIKDINFNNII